MLKRRQLAVDDLLLDTENPRLGEVGSQAEALERIITLGVSDFRDMMKSLSSDGLDPGDSFYVIASGRRGDYIVLDGNRRLSALKILRQASLIEGTNLNSALKRSLAKLAEISVSVDVVDCVVFDSRDDANIWIRRRHGRDQGGERRISWDTLQTQRFLKDRSLTDFIDMMENSEVFDAETWSTIRAKVEKNSSTLERIVESSPFKDLLGLSNSQVDGETIPEVMVDAPFVVGLMSEVFKDIAGLGENVNTRILNEKEDIAKYLGRVQERAQVAPQRSDEAKKVRSIEPPSSPKTKKKEQQPKTQSPQKSRAAVLRKTLAPRYHDFEQPDPLKMKALIGEASGIVLQKFPMASAFLFRAVIEHALDVYMRKHQLPKIKVVPMKGAKDRIVDFTLAERAASVIDHINQSTSPPTRDLNAVRQVLTSKDHPASIVSLNDFHHNPHSKPAIDALRNGWDSAIPLFVGIFGEAKKKS